MNVARSRDSPRVGEDFTRFVGGIDNCLCARSFAVMSIAFRKGSQCRGRSSKRPKVLGRYVGAGGPRNEGVHFARGNWSLGSIPIRRIEQPRPSECRQILDHSRKRTILNFLFNLFATLSFELDYDLVAFNRNVLF